MRRWVLWLLLVAVIAAPVVLCQAVLAPPHAVPGASIVSVGCAGDGHDDQLCTVGDTAAATAPRGGRDGSAHVAVVVGLAFALVLRGFGGSSILPVRSVTGPPPSSPLRLVPGWRRLVALGITRV